MKVDLHSHSSCSDGTYSPSQLLLLAKEASIDVFALTDHDTLAGLQEARAQAHALGIHLINGVEISCHHQVGAGYGNQQVCDKVIHVVALGFDKIDVLQSKLQALQNSRAYRGRQMVNNLHQPLAQHNKTCDEVWQLVLKKVNDNPKAVGRAHIAQVLADIGVVKSIQESFDKYLADGKMAYVAIDALSMEQTIALIHACGGLAILAHPTRYGLSATKIRRLIGDFACFGGDALELPNNEPVSTRAMIDRCVKQYGLMVSVGSDFHGTNMPWRKLGQVAVPALGQVGVWQRLLNEHGSTLC